VGVSDKVTESLGNGIRRATMNDTVHLSKVNERSRIIIDKLIPCWCKLPAVVAIGGKVFNEPEPSYLSADHVSTSNRSPVALRNGVAKRFWGQEFVFSALNWESKCERGDE
jgi:hypothetical protein